MTKIYPSEKRILRDDLAIDRTKLANERTFLSYLRTSLAVLVVGGTIIHFIPTASGFTFGLLFVAMGVIILFVGVKRFLIVRREMNDLK